MLSFVYQSGQMCLIGHILDILMSGSHSITAISPIVVSDLSLSLLLSVSLPPSRMRNLMTYFVENERELLAIPIVGIVVNVVLYMFILSTFFLASFIDPGIYPRGKCIIYSGRSFDHMTSVTHTLYVRTFLEYPPV